MQKFLENTAQWFLSLLAAGFFLVAAGCVFFRGYIFLRYGYNPEMPISAVAGNYYFDWAGVQKIVDLFLGLPIESGLAVFGVLFLYWAGSVDS